MGPAGPAGLNISIASEARPVSKDLALIDDDGIAPITVRFTGLQIR